MEIKVLDKGYVQLQDVMGDDLAIVNAARVSYLGENKGDKKDKKLLFYLMEHKHTTPFEMVEFKFRIKCPLFIARQWMRHRTWSYNEVSRRYTSDNIEFYIPEQWRLQDNKNKQGSIDGLTHYWIRSLQIHSEESLLLYNRLINNGIAREQARMVLPQNMYTEFVAKVDCHNLLHFIRLRMDSHAQYEMQLYANALYEIVKEKLPWTSEAFEKFR